jgi:hypothetical protein
MIMRTPSPYLMRDFHHDKIDSIMAFNVAGQRLRPRAMLELSLFLGAVAGYLGALALAA